MRGLRRRLESLGRADVIARRWTEAAAWLCALAGAAIFALFGVDRHRAFQSNAYDYAFFDQIIWNTAHGRWFETSFLTYNFLGQHFEPVLLLFALGYRLGAGVESLIVTQAVFVAAAAVPLYYAARRATRSGVCALMLAAAYLLSAPLHNALDFDFHPELMGLFFVFLALHFLVSERPEVTIAALVPLLALKEDLALILLAFAFLLFVRGQRSHAVMLGGIAVAYVAAVVLVTMPAIRGGPGDLTERYAYLGRDSTVWTLVPHVGWRAAAQFIDALPSIITTEASLGFAALLSPLGVLAAAPNVLLATLSNHPQQSALDLHYVMAPLALSWVSAVIGIAALAGRRRATHGIAAPPARPRWYAVAVFCVSAAMLGGALVTFDRSSPYATARDGLSASHQSTIRDALALVPSDADASVSAQGTLLPHLSQRREAYEFPQLHGAEYVVIDATLPVTGQARDAGYDRVAAELTQSGYEEIFMRDGVRVLRRLP